MADDPWGGAHRTPAHMAPPAASQGTALHVRYLDQLDHPPAQDGDVPPGHTIRAASMLFPEGGAQPRCYAVLDAARFSFLPDMLATSGLEHACLFTGEAAREMRDSAPYLVALTPEHSLTVKLLSPAAGPPMGLWDLELGCYLHSTAPFDAVRSHLRKFTRIRLADGAWRFMRFWEPSVFGPYFEQVAQRDGSAKLFAPGHLDLTFFYICADGTGYAVGMERAAVPRRRDDFILHTDAMTEVTARNRISAFCAENGMAYDPDAYAHVDFTHHDPDDLAIVSVLVAHFGLDASRHDPTGFSGGMATQSKRSLLRRLLFFKAQDVSIGL